MEFGKKAAIANAGELVGPTEASKQFTIGKMQWASFFLFSKGGPVHDAYKKSRTHTKWARTNDRTTRKVPHWAAGQTAGISRNMGEWNRPGPSAKEGQKAGRQKSEVDSKHK